jgi:hypothetical protein
MVSLGSISMFAVQQLHRCTQTTKLVHIYHVFARIFIHTQVQHKREGAQFGGSEIDPAALVTHPSAITINPATLGTSNSSGAINSTANISTGNSRCVHSAAEQP